MSLAFAYNLLDDTSKTSTVYGMNVAVRDWFRAYFRYGTAEKINLLIDNATGLRNMQELAQQCALDPTRLVPFDRRFVQENFGHFTTIFRPDPHPQNLLWQRETLATTPYTFCGLAHAISGFEIGEVLERYILGPARPGDAVVAPSHAVASAIRAFWQNYADYLKERFGTIDTCPVDLPVIPLGVDIEKFERLSTPSLRADQRHKLGISEEETVVLWVGRMSHAIKAHPIAMFKAVERAADMSRTPIHFVMYGYFVPEEAGESFRNLAGLLCSKAKVSFISNQDTRFPDGLWAAGDIFFSLVDNMQESFGLTPIEAMAAGLPRVISDWDGYRDSVTNGVDGYLVPTTQPPAGAGRDLTELVMNGTDMYGGYMAKTALCVAVDHEQAAHYLSHLATNREVAREMANKARQRVHTHYAWRTIIASYETMWQEQVIKSKSAARSPKSWPSLFPQCPDPFTMYHAFPTRALSEHDRLTLIASADHIRDLWRVDINVLGLDIMLPPDTIQAILKTISHVGECTIAQLIAIHAPMDPSSLWRTIAWLLKLGIIARRS